MCLNSGCVYGELFPKIRKMWERFKLWMSTNECQTANDFEEMSVSTFKISDDEETCRCETEEGEYKHCKRQKESEKTLKQT